LLWTADQAVGDIEMECCCRYEQRSPPAAAAVAVQNGGKEHKPSTGVIALRELETGIPGLP
jgi:hypothetical protein